MDSWTDAQLALMKAGGNDKLNQFLQKHGVASRTPVREKYNSPAAQLYKQVLKARVEGKPEPTELPKVAPPSAGDAHGMQRLQGETDAQYVARQTRLKDEARKRMQAKFGGSGGLGGASGMQGVGSDPNYNPNSGYGSSGTSDLLAGIGSGFGAVMGTAGNIAGSVASKLQDERTLNQVSAAAGGFWGSLTAGVSQMASVVSQPEQEDGLAQLQRQVAAQKPSESIYAGFGSNASTLRQSATPLHSGAISSVPHGGGTALQEAPGLPHEDRNGMERLTGETDDQYVLRQTRLRDEARARMAAKFGGGGMGGVGSGINNSQSAPPSSNAGHVSRATPPNSSTTPTKPTGTDFFSSFGT